MQNFFPAHFPELEFSLLKTGQGTWPGKYLQCR